MLSIVSFAQAQPRNRSTRTASRESSSADWVGVSATRRSRHGKSARTASAVALIDSGVIVRQHAATPALFASFTKIAAVRGEKNSAKSIAPQRKAWTVDAL